MLEARFGTRAKRTSSEANLEQSALLTNIHYSTQFYFFARRRYCQKTKVHSWEMPKEVKILQDKAFESATSRWETLQKTSSMRIKKIGVWIQYTGGMGKTFYFNEKTFEFQWETPENMGFDEPPDKKKLKKNEDRVEKGKTKKTNNGPPPSKKNSNQGNNNNNAKNKNKNKELMASLEQDKANILAMWKTYRDPETNMTFFYNEVTQESLWEPPPGLTMLEKKLATLMEQLGDDEDEDDEAMVVNGDDDLFA